MSKPKDLRSYFPDDRGWEIFQALMKAHDDLRAELARTTGQLAKARAVSAAERENTVEEAIASLMTGARSSRPDARVRKDSFFRGRQ